MLEQLILGSEAVAAAPGRGLIPAALACPDCGALRMITSPAPLRCEDCGTVMEPAESGRSPSAPGR